MPLSPTPDKIADIQKTILGLSRADACQVWMEGSRWRNIRFASSGGGSNGDNIERRIYITSTIGKRSGRASTTDFSANALYETLKKSEAAAQFANENPETLPPLGPQTFLPTRAFIPTTDALNQDQIAALIQPALNQARRAGVTYAGFVHVWSGWRAFATSNGLQTFDRTTKIGMTMTTRNAADTWSGWGGAYENDVANFNAADLAARAIEKAKATPDPIALDPGKYVVLLEPAVTATLISGLMYAFGARPADEGRSFLSRPGGGNRLGDMVFDPRVTIQSDPASTAAPEWSLSNDGLPNGPVSWIEKGAVKTLVRDRYWAERTALPPVPRAGSYYMTGGQDSVSDMIKDVKRGILVTRLWYVRSVDPKTLLTTGLTRDGTFLIENGAITRPIQNFRFNESPLSALNNLLAIGPSVRAPLAESYETISAPPLLVKDFNFTSISPGI